MNQEEKMPNNTSIIALLVILLIAVLGIGGYFIIKDISSGNNDNSSSQSQNTNNKDSGGQSTPSDDNTGGNSGDSGGSEQPAISELEAGITYAEKRGVNFYVEVQANDVITGRCDFSLIPTDGGQGHQNSNDLAPQNKISICSDSVSIKGLNPGEHKLTVVIRAADGRTKTLEQIVNIQ
ncbi:hypothetical protein IKG12_00545 [Candidatus Saccharibacteria bacterium]|nr:hypothetical protein [Candidatus Saccharibacteria bacterium]